MSDEPLNAFERETVITASDGDEHVRIWSCQRRYLSRLRKHPAFTEVASGFHGSTEWAEFVVGSHEWNPASGGKRKRNMTDEQKQALRDRLARAREAADGNGDDHA